MQEGDVALVILVVTEGVRDLLQDDDDADAHEHALDHAAGEVVGDHSGAGDAQDHLHDSGEHYRSEEEREGAELRDRYKHDRSQACGRATYAHG